MKESVTAQIHGRVVQYSHPAILPDGDPMGIGHPRAE